MNSLMRLTEKAIKGAFLVLLALTAANIALGILN